MSAFLCAGGPVAVLQSLCATGAIVPILAGTAAVAAVAIPPGVAAACTVSNIKSCKIDSSKITRSPSPGSWVIGSEQGTWNVVLYEFGSEEEARKAFKQGGRVRRILVSPSGKEVLHAGDNSLADNTIRRSLNLPDPHARRV